MNSIDVQYFSIVGINNDLEAQPNNLSLLVFVKERYTKLISVSIDTFLISSMADFIHRWGRQRE
jgi:hypothetical protein